jgi:hypothetical protein
VKKEILSKKRRKRVHKEAEKVVVEEPKGKRVRFS